MFVTHGSKNSLFFVFDFLSNLDCGQWYKFWIYQSHPMSSPATQSVDSQARASFSYGHFCVQSFFCWMVGHFLLRIATRRRRRGSRRDAPAPPPPLKKRLAWLVPGGFSPITCSPRVVSPRKVSRFAQLNRYYIIIDEVLFDTFLVIDSIVVYKKKIT